jgi:hypothetical protein
MCNCVTAQGGDWQGVLYSGTIGWVLKTGKEFTLFETDGGKQAMVRTCHFGFRGFQDLSKGVE